MTGDQQVRRLPDPQAVARAAADQFVRLSALRADGLFNVALSGGSTPMPLYRLLAEPLYADRVDWGRIHFFWGDERPVPPQHPDSNYRAAYEALLSRVPVPPPNLHRIPAELGPQVAALSYQAELRRHFRLSESGLPRFDMVILGMGGDGHTASLFPGSEALQEGRRLVVASWVATQESYRITLTCPVFNNSAFIMFLVTGEAKAATLKAVLEGPADRYPAQLIRPGEGELVWYIDGAAARLLEGGTAALD